MKILKPLRDIALIFYDDLEFKAMSLPRLEFLLRWWQ
jgi:hypothetical protein